MLKIRFEIEYENWYPIVKEQRYPEHILKRTCENGKKKKKIEIDSLLRRINADPAQFVIANENKGCDVREKICAEYDPFKTCFSRGTTRQKEINDSFDLMTRRWSGRW